MAPKGRTSTAVEASSGDSEIQLPADPQVFINKEVAGIGNYVPETWEDLLERTGGEFIEFEGSPWHVLDKAKLVAVPFMIADVRHYKGNFGDAIAMLVMTREALPGERTNRYVINDGSTGIYEQVVGMIERTKKKSGIMCPNGLRASTYDWQEKDFDGNPIGEVHKATTYYIA